MSRFANAVFIVLTALFIIGPTLLYAAQNLIQINLPNFVTTIEADQLQQQHTDANVKANASISHFLSKQFQTAFETELNNYIPAKGRAMLSNANAQRTIIRLANSIPKYECYPARLDSIEFSVIEHENALVATAESKSEENMKSVDGWIANINQSIAKHPDITFVYDLVDDTYSSTANPTNKYVSNSYNSEWSSDNIVKRLDPHAIVLTEDITSEADLLENWFISDHHWKPKRAFASYEQIAQTLNLQQFEYHDEEICNEWFGASARVALDLDYYDSLYDSPTDFSMLNVTINGQVSDRGLRDLIMRDEITTLYDTPFHSYHNYFGNTTQEVMYENGSSNNKRNCLFIEQSYGIPIERYFASNYATTICIDPRNTTVTKTLEEYINEYDIDDVIIQMNYSNIWKIRDHSPAYTNTTQ